jgi:hypothetical protein
MMPTTTDRPMPASTGSVVSATLLAARLARSELRWMQAAVLFTHAADALPRPHGIATAGELQLRRDAFLCLCRTTQFVAHRERCRVEARRRQSFLHVADDFSNEWRQPSGDLVRQLGGLAGKMVRS